LLSRLLQHSVLQSLVVSTSNVVFFVSFCFFFTDPATTEIYTLSLHDALPILCARSGWISPVSPAPTAGQAMASFSRPRSESRERSEEHTSELQSRGHLVCRLLLEKKKRKYRAVSLT